MIISDISKREIVIKGRESEERALSIKSQCEREEKVHDVDIEQVDLDVFKITIIYSVGDYFRK